MVSGRFIYPAACMPDPDGKCSILFLDFPEARGRGNSESFCCLQAKLSLEDAVLSRMAKGESLPVPTKITRGMLPSIPLRGAAGARLAALKWEYKVPLGAGLAAKAHLYLSFQQSGLSHKDFAARVKRPEQEIREIFAPHSQVDLRQMEALFQALGKILTLDVVELPLTRSRSKSSRSSKTWLEKMF